MHKINFQLVENPETLTGKFFFCTDGILKLYLPSICLQMFYTYRPDRFFTRLPRIFWPAYPTGSGAIVLHIRDRVIIDRALVDNRTPYAQPFRLQMYPDEKGYAWKNREQHTGYKNLHAPVITNLILHPDEYQVNDVIQVRTDLVSVDEFLRYSDFFGPSKESCDRPMGNEAIYLQSAESGSVGSGKIAAQLAKIRRKKREAWNQRWMVYQSQDIR